MVAAVRHRYVNSTTTAARILAPLADLALWMSASRRPRRQRRHQRSSTLVSRISRFCCLERITPSSMWERFERQLGRADGFFLCSRHFAQAVRDLQRFQPPSDATDNGHANPAW